jgi:hypothetical protein
MRFWKWVVFPIFCFHNTKTPCLFLHIATVVASVITKFKIFNMCTSTCNDKHHFIKLVAKEMKCENENMSPWMWIFHQFRVDLDFKHKPTWTLKLFGHLYQDKINNSPCMIYYFTLYSEKPKFLNQVFRLDVESNELLISLKQDGCFITAMFFFLFFDSSHHLFINQCQDLTNPHKPT